jgi:hypothetical protein
MPLGQIGLCTTTGFFGWLIRTVTRSTVNHVVIGVGDGLVVSAEPGGVRARPERYWPPIVWSELPLSDMQKQHIALYALHQIGTPYDYLADAAIGIALITGEHTPKWLARYLRSNKRWQCAALADSACRHAGVHLFRDHRTTSAVYPGSFEKVWRAFGWMK